MLFVKTKTVIIIALHQNFEEYLNVISKYSWVKVVRFSDN